MFIRTISIARDGDFGYGPIKADKPFLAKIQVEGQNGKTELYLSADMSLRIMEIVAEKVAGAGRATADAMVAEAMTYTLLPSPQSEGAEF